MTVQSDNKSGELRVDESGLKHTVQLKPDDAARIVRYLSNPTQAGIWQFTGAWNQNGTFAQSIWNEVGPRLKSSNAVDISFGQRNIRLKLNPGLIDRCFDRATTRMSFVFSLFTYLLFSERQSVDSASFAEAYHQVDQIIFSVVDLKKIQANHAEAYEWFKNEVYVDGFKIAFHANKPHIFKHGLAILVEPHRKAGKFSIVAPDRAILESLHTFFKKLDAVSDGAVMPVFSPEDRVFAPYFNLLQAAFPYCIEDASIHPIFLRAVSDYVEGNYSNCIRTLGLIGEDYLVQVYETFFREACPKGLTLGQIFDQIHNKISVKFKKPAKAPPEIGPLYERIKALSASVPATPSGSDYENLLKLLREVVNFVKEDRARTVEAIADITREQPMISVLPRSLRDNLTDLIRYRNAVSHKSRVVVGSYEALRSVYACVTLLLWWTAEKRAIDWTVSQDEILLRSIERNGDGSYSGTTQGRGPRI